MSVVCCLLPDTRCFQVKLPFDYLTLHKAFSKLGRNLMIMLMMRLMMHVYIVYCLCIRATHTHTPIFALKRMLLWCGVRVLLFCLASVVIRCNISCTGWADFPVILNKLGCQIGYFLDFK